MWDTKYSSYFWGFTRCFKDKLELDLNWSPWFVDEISIEIASLTLARWISSFFQALFSSISPGFALVTERSIYCTHKACFILRALKDFYCERMETLDEYDGLWSWKDLLWTIASRLKSPRGWQAYCPFQRLNSLGKIFSLGSCNCICEISVHSAWALWFECFLLYFPPVDWFLKRLLF